METPPVVAARAPRTARPATIEDWLAIPEEKRAELIDGVIVYQSMPGPKHGRTQSKVCRLIDGPFDGPPGGSDRPGGWWISLEVDMDLAGLGCRPDVLGWRRSRQPSLPEPDKRGVVTAVPDWICEVLSISTAYIDQGQKRRAYHRAGVEHYWLLDPTNRTLTVLERTDRDYLIVLVAGPNDVVRAAPFEAVEIAIAEMFGDDGAPAAEPAPGIAEPGGASE